MSDQSRSPENQSFLDTSFLQGANAVYLEQMAAAYARDPGSVPPSWKAFFDAMGDAPADASHAARGPAWKRPGWPKAANGDLVSALGDIGPDEAAMVDKVAEHVAGRVTGPSEAQ